MAAFSSYHLLNLNHIFGPPLLSPPCSTALYSSFSELTISDVRYSALRSLKAVTVAEFTQARSRIVLNRSTTSSVSDSAASLDSDDEYENENESEDDEEEEAEEGEFDDEDETEGQFGDDEIVGEIEEGDDDGDEADVEGEVEKEVDEEEVVAVKVDRSKLPNLSVKEKKELASYAHSLGKKLKIQLVGKSGVTASVATSFVETLEANELLKIKIHATCPDEVPDVVRQLEDYTGSVVVSQIGRTVIIYRPSISKMKAEQRRRTERRVYVRKSSEFKPSFPKKGATSRPKEETPRPNEPGRRGSSRANTANSY